MYKSYIHDLHIAVHYSNDKKMIATEYTYIQSEWIMSSYFSFKSL